MNNEIIISNIAPQDIIIEGGGSTIGLTAVYVNGVNVTVGSVAYVIVPTKLSELENNVGYITSETDPTVPTYIKQITMSDITSWNNKQNLLVSGTNIKTINNNSILGSGNLDISTSYTAGTGIEITEENVINNTITSYNDLTDRPTIPTHTSDLINDSNFVNGNSLSQVAYTGDYYDLIGKPDLSEYITKYVDNLVNYYTKDFMYGLLPKVSDEDTSITLNNTYPSELKLSLNPSELSQDGTPTPSTPYDIHTISGSNKVVVCGKNLWNEQWETGGINNNTGAKETASGFIRTKDYTSIEASTTYYKTPSTEATRIFFYTENKTYISNVSVEAVGGTFTTPNNAKYLLFKQYETTYNNDIAIIKGSSGNYEPYTSQEANIDLGDIEYCKIGNYEDEFYKATDSDTSLISGKWYLKKNIGKVVLDGSENWYSNQTSEVNRRFHSNIFDGNRPIQSYVGLLNYFQVKKNSYKDGANLYANDINIYLWLDMTIANTTDAFKSWLSTHNTIVYYPLATPTYIPLNDTLQSQLEYIYNQMLSYQGQTSISQENNDLPFNIVATTLKDISSL